MLILNDLNLRCVPCSISNRLLQGTLEDSCFQWVTISIASHRTAPLVTPNTSYTITADIDVPQGGAEGVIVGEGGRFVGYALYLRQGKPVFTYNLMDLKRTRWEGPSALTPGKSTIEFDFRYDGLGAATLAYNNLSGVGRGGTGTMTVDGTVVSTQTLGRTVPLSLLLDQRFFIGIGGPTPVDDRG